MSNTASEAKLSKQSSMASTMNLQQTNSQTHTLNHANTARSVRPNSATSESPSSPQNSRRQRFVLTDPVAFSYLEEDHTTIVLESRRELKGYQCYLIEQWAISRKHPTFIITTYTGDPTHSVVAGILSVPANEEAWSPRLRIYFKSLHQHHARRMDTQLGTLMVTNLDGFPPSLNIIPIPHGDPKRHREDFVVNENLKRLNCSGRIALTFSEPTNATQAKFRQLYKVSDKTPLYASVIELIKLCQVALLLFGKLDADYADGLFCDVTEQAVGNWWVDIGSDFYNAEPSDGVLGPSTVAGLLGLLMGARNRLNACGAPVAKDVFDVEATKRGITYFQKVQKIPKTRRLDRHTLRRLHHATAKQASAEEWGVSRAVKSTMAEISGRGGEMVMEIVGSRDKATISEVETVDIEAFSHLVKGDHAKWLWHGKARKRTTRDMLSESMQGHKSYQEDEDEGMQTAQRVDSDVDRYKVRKALSNTTRGEQDLSDADAQKRTVYHRAKGRIKDAVKKGAGPVKSKDGLSIDTSRNRSADTIFSQTTSPPGSPSNARRQEEYFGSMQHDAYENNEIMPEEPEPVFTRVISETPIDTAPPGLLKPPPNNFGHRHHELDTAFKFNESLSRTATAASTAETPSVRNIELDFDLPDGLPIDTDINRTIIRRTSYSNFQRENLEKRHDEWWPRQLSFSAAESCLYSIDWPISESRPQDSYFTNPKQDLRREHLLAGDAQLYREHIDDLAQHLAPAAQRKLRDVEALDMLAAQDTDQLNEICYPHRTEYSALQEGSREIVSQERDRLVEALKHIETMGAKLEYEINGLKSKVEDVEDAVEEFEKQVVYTEGRVGDLVAESSKNSWLSSMLRFAFASGKTAADQAAKDS